MSSKVLRIIMVGVFCTSTLVMVACGAPKEDPIAKYNDMIEEYRAMRIACDEVQGQKAYADTLKANLESITKRYNEVYQHNIDLQVEYSEVVGKYRLLEQQYNNLKGNYESMITGIAQGQGIDEEFERQYQDLYERYQVEIAKTGKYDELLDLVMMVSRRECPEINSMSASEQTVFYKGWNLWGVKYVSEFYASFNLVPGSFDSLWSVIEMVSERQCHELETQLTEAEMTSFLKVWGMWRDKYVDKYEDSDDFNGLLAVVLEVSRREVSEINNMTADINAFYKGWGIWGIAYVQPIIP